jgi:hypothetical protein
MKNTAKDILSQKNNPILTPIIYRPNYKIEQVQKNEGFSAKEIKIIFNGMYIILNPFFVSTFKFNCSEA